MKNLIKFCLVAIMILLPFSCDQESSDIATNGVENFNKASSEDADFILSLPSLMPYGNASASLVRNKNGATANFNAMNLEPGAYTLWVIVFNNRSNCGGEPCAEADLFNPDVEGDALFGAGHVVGNNGRGNFSAHLGVGDISGSLGFNNGLLDPEGAEIHLVLRYHGPVIPGMVDEQIHTIDGGCQTNDCEDVLAAVFMPS